MKVIFHTRGIRKKTEHQTEMNLDDSSSLG